MDDDQIKDRLAKVESRLSSIEGILGIYLPSEKKPSTSSQEASSRPSGPVPAEKRGNWLGLIAIICFVMAAAFIIKLSIESGWLTPVRQIGIAMLFGLILIGIGLVLIRKDLEYASLLPAAGIIILDLSIFAAFIKYSLISFIAGITWISLISALCIWLYIKIRHDIYPLISAVGVYIAPILFGYEVNPLFTLYYFMVSSITFAGISVLVQSRTLTVVAAYLAIFLTAYIGLSLNWDLFIAEILLFQFLVFSLGTFLYTKISHQPLTEKEAWAFFPVLLFFYAMEYYFIDKFSPDAAPWISLGFAALLIGLYLGAKKLVPEKSFASQGMILAFATIVAFHSIYLELLPENAKPWLFAFFILLFAFIPTRYLSVRQGAYAIPAMAICIIAFIEYTNIITHLFYENPDVSWILTAVAGLLSVWILFLKQHTYFESKNEFGFVVLSAAHLLAISALYQLTTDISSLAVSLSWLLYAICVITFAFYRKDKIMANSALLVLSFAAGKALLYDAASAATIVRIVCLLVTGAVLYGSGFLYRQIDKWPGKQTKK